MEMKNLQKQEVNMVQKNFPSKESGGINELEKAFKYFKDKIAETDDDLEEEKIRGEIRSWIREQINSINDLETGKYLISLSEDGQRNDLPFSLEYIRIQAKIESKIARDITNTEEELNEFLKLKLRSANAEEVALKKLIDLTEDYGTLLSLAKKNNQPNDERKTKIRDLALKKIINLKDISNQELMLASETAGLDSDIEKELIKKAEENKKPL